MSDNKCIICWDIDVERTVEDYTVKFASPDTMESWDPLSLLSIVKTDNGSKDV